MTEQEVYKIVKPLLEGYTEGLFWDFKKVLYDTAEIIKDILAFSNSNHEGDSYIIVGVSEPDNSDESNRIQLTTEDRRRLNTDANYLYLPGTWKVNGLSSNDIEKMNKFSETLTSKLSASMLISQPKCEFYPISIRKNLWLYVIVIKPVPGVFISKKDITKDTNSEKVVVKQGVLYVRIADTTTIGSDTIVASATEYIRVWKKYIDWLDSHEFPKLAEGCNA
ncbi:MAG: hypothetical protein EOM67_13520 [Spirochaetia bacterium]|nr:hypothetical protein [Spirochaetia bacterium]